MSAVTPSLKSTVIVFAINDFCPNDQNMFSELHTSHHPATHTHTHITQHTTTQTHTHTRLQTNATHTHTPRHTHTQTHTHTHTGLSSALLLRPGHRDQKATNSERPPCSHVPSRCHTKTHPPASARAHH